MQKADHLRGKWWSVPLFLTALLVVAFDQPSKMWIRSYPLGHPIFKIAFFRLTHVGNTGAAFGLFQGQSFILTIVALVGIATLLLLALFIPHRFPLPANMPNRIALGLILGGTVGNLVDRLFFGYVTDFVSVGIWPAFNIADSAIVIGVIIIAYSLLRLARAEKH